MTIDQDTYGKDHPYLVYHLVQLGTLALIRKQYSKAQQWLQRCLAICHNKNCDPPDLGRVRFSLARLLWQSGGDPKRAIMVAHKAREAFLQAGKPLRAELSEVEAWIKKVSAKVPETP